MVGHHDQTSHTVEHNLHDQITRLHPSVGTGFGPVAFVAFGLRLGHEAGGLRPPLASPAPTSLACPHAEE